MRSACLLLLFILTSQVIVAQESKAYNDLHRQLMSELAATDIDYAFIMVDSLRLLATSEQEQIKADQVLAYLHYQKGDKVTALNLAMENEEKFRKNGNYTEQVGVIGFIASNFKELKLYNEADFYLNKAEKSLGKLPNANLKAQFGTLIYHEKIDITLNREKLLDAAKYVKKAYEYVDGIEVPHVKSYFLAVTVERDAVLAFKNKQFEKSFDLNMKALETLESKEEILYGIIHLNLGRIALVNNTYDLVPYHLQEVEQMVESSQYFNLKKRLHEIYIDYYTALDNDEEKQKHEAAVASLIQKEKENVELSANVALLRMRTEINKYRYGLWIVIGLSGITLLLIGIIYYKKRFYKREVLNKQALPLDKNVTNSTITPANNSMDAISDETESRIVESLNNIERTTFFIKSDITLARLAYQLDTNTRYLSYVINTHRGKAFPVYINDLRINYIVGKLKTEPIFLKYKISHLAELSGFSSHSKFSSEFRRVVGESPSKYILDVQKI